MPCFITISWSSRYELGEILRPLPSRGTRALSFVLRELTLPLSSEWKSLLVRIRGVRSSGVSFLQITEIYLFQLSGLLRGAVRVIGSCIAEGEVQIKVPKDHEKKTREVVATHKAEIGSPLKLHQLQDALNFVRKALRELEDLPNNYNLMNVAKVAYIFISAHPPSNSYHSWSRTSHRTLFVRKTAS